MVTDSEVRSEHLWGFTVLMVLGAMVLEEQSPSANRGKNVVISAVCRKPEAVWHPEAVTNPHTTSRLSFLLGV